MAEKLRGIFEDLERNAGLKRIDNESEIDFNQANKVLGAKNPEGEVFMLFEYMESFSDRIYNFLTIKRLSKSYLAYADGEEELLGIVPRESYRDVGEILLENGFTNKHYDSTDQFYVIEKAWE